MIKRLLILFAFLLNLFAGIAQERTITGKVIDETGAPMPGATVSIKGTTKGTITDLDGKYSISVPASGGTLVVSYVGYQPKDVEIGTENTIDVNLSQDVKSLEQVVVVGYGVQKKSLVTGSISKLESKDITNAPAARLEQALQGKTSGVYIAQNSGTPGGGYSISIRGNSSDSKNGPLYIVDGVKTSGIEFLSPNDIESLEILKDAASCAIYGADGGNGVVIVSTKKAKGGIAEVNYNYYHGWQAVGNYTKQMDAKQYIDYKTEALKYEYPKWETYPANNPVSQKLRLLETQDSLGYSTNWMKELFQTAPVDEHNISITTGNEKSNLFLSGSYYSQDGIIGGSKSNFTRYTFRMNGESKIKSWLNVGCNASYTQSEKNNIFESSEFGGIITSAMFFDPTVPVYYNDTSEIDDAVKADKNNFSAMVKGENGKYYHLSSLTVGEAVNPVAFLDIQHNKTTINRILSDAHADLMPFKGLKITSKLSLDFSLVYQNIFNPDYFFNGQSLRLGNANSVENQWIKKYDYSFENYATYNKTFGDHSIELMAGMSYEENTPQFIYGKAFNIPYNDPAYAILNESLELQSVNTLLYGGPGDETYRFLEIQQSYFGRFVYNYKEKYILQGNIRRDGSTLFGPGHQYAVFPSFSAGWNIHNEDFFSGLNQTITKFKVRASWGQNGSKTALALKPFLYTSPMLTVYYPDANDNLVLGKVPMQKDNPNLKWETSEQTDIGIDLGFLKNSMTFSVDYFVKTTKDQLAQDATVSYAYGYGALPWTNAGNVENKGLEFDLSYRNGDGEFKYTTSFNASYIKNKVTEFGTIAGQFRDGTRIGTEAPGTRYEAGQPVWYFRGFKTLGIFQDTAEINHYGGMVYDKNKGKDVFKMYQPKAKPGDVKFSDVNNDGKLDDADRTYIGKPMPDWTFGFNFSCEYKGFDLAMFMQGVTGNQILFAATRQDAPDYNKAAFWYTERWTPEKGGNKYPRSVAYDQNANFRLSDLMISDADYLRLKNLTIGYTLPKSFTSKVGISKLRVYGTGSNLITFTAYKGNDPEIGQFTNGLTTGSDPSLFGVDKGLYPSPRTYTLGLNLTF